MKILYTAKVMVSGGRDGHIQSDDGNLELNLSLPKSLGGAGKAGATNPEQLFAAGYAACFESAIRHVARGLKITIAELSVQSEVSLTPVDTGFALLVSLHPKFTGLEQNVCEDLVASAHKVCPYSNAVRNNIDVHITVK